MLSRDTIKSWKGLEDLSFSQVMNAKTQKFTVLKEAKLTNSITNQDNGIFSLSPCVFWSGKWKQYLGRGMDQASGVLVQRHAVHNMYVPSCQCYTSIFKTSKSWSVWWLLNESCACMLWIWKSLWARVVYKPWIKRKPRDKEMSLRVIISVSVK